jgi:hypothetical protein
MQGRRLAVPMCNAMPNAWMNANEQPIGTGPVDCSLS